MAAILERYISPLAPWAKRLGGFTIVLMITAWIFHRSFLIQTGPFLILAALCLIIAILGVVFSLAAFVDIWRQGSRGFGQASLGLLYSLIALLPFGIAAERYFIVPVLNDVATDVKQPPKFDELALNQERDIARLLFSPTLQNIHIAEPIPDEAQQYHAVGTYPDLIGRFYLEDLDIVMEKVRGLIAERKWQILSIVVTDEDLTIQVKAWSFLLAMPSRAAIRVARREEGNYVDMRSASLFDFNDFGENKEIIKRFLADLDHALGHDTSAGLAEPTGLKNQA